MYSSDIGVLYTYVCLERMRRYMHVVVWIMYITEVRTKEPLIGPDSGKK